MIQPSTQSNISGVEAQSFTIEANESMFALLTSRVYNDTISAPIREWSTNAVDACLAAGIPAKFDVHLPTFEEPTFSVRDYGDGLPLDDIVGLFCIFGASTKRDSNRYNGTFGIGRMSGLAYASSFTVESYHNGNYYSYLITIKDGLPAAVQLADTSTTEPNGLRLSLSVEPSDISTFQSRAQRLYRYFDEKPTLNIDLDISTPEALVSGEGWQIDNTSVCNRIRMANVIYNIPSDSQLNTKGFYSLVIDVPIGAIAINPGRESLSMDKSTIDFLNGRFSSIHAEYLLSVTEAIEEHDSPRKRLLAYSEAYRIAPSSVQKKIPVPSDAGILAESMGCTWNGPKINIESTDTFKVRLISPSLTNPVHFNERSVSYGEFFSYAVIVVDTKTNFSRAIKDIRRQSNEYYILLSRVGNVDFDEYLDDVKDFVSFYDFDPDNIYYTSKYTTESPRSSTDSTRSTGVVYAISYDDSFKRFSGELQPSDDTTHVYVPIKGYEAYLDAGHINAIFRLLLYFNKKLIGVQKKYLKDVEAKDNFILADDFLQEHLSSKHFHCYDDFDQLYLLDYYRSSYEKFPKHLQPTVKAYRHYRFNDHDEPRMPIDTLNLVKKYYDIKHTIHRLPYSREQFVKELPLLNALRNSNGSKQEYYLTLEALRYDSSHTNGG